MQIFSEEGVKTWVNIDPEVLGITKTPRELVEKFPNVDFIPISGSWGYNKDDSVVIEKNDKMNSKIIPFDGYSIENIFIEKRIYLELITLRAPEVSFHHIKWKLLEQKLVNTDNKYFDHFKYFVTGYIDDEWKSLKKESDDNNGFINNPEGLKKHELKREELIHGYETNYWFEITSFYNQ